MRPIALTLALLASTASLTACGTGTDAGAPATTVQVTATDTTCVLDRTDVAAGRTRFTVTNGGSEITEVYVYAEADGAFTSVVSEVENIGPGTSRDMEVDLGGGTYEVACKPGQTGEGIRATLMVEGASASEGSSSAAREVELRIDASDSLVGVDAVAPRTGERLEFKVTNTGSEQRIFEVKRPDGSVAGEIEIAPAAEGELYVDLDVDGDWLLIVEGGSTETEATLRVA